MTNPNPPVAPAGTAAKLSLGQLIDAWYMGERTQESVTPIDVADDLLISGEHDKALTAYSMIPERSAELLSREGVAHYLAGRPLESATLMDVGVCMASAPGKAMLAAVKQDARLIRRAWHESIHDLQALAVEAALDSDLSPYAIRCFWTLAGGIATDEQRLEVARRGLDASGELYLLAREALALSSLGRAAEINMPRLSEAASRNESCAAAMLEITLDSGPWDAADAAVAHLKAYAKTESDPFQTAALLQALVDVSAARSLGDLERAQRALSFTDTHPCRHGLSDSDRSDGESYPLDDFLNVSAIRMDAASILGLDDVVIETATRIGMAYLLHDDYQPSFDMADVALAAFRRTWWVKDVFDRQLSTELIPQDNPLRWMMVIIDLEEERKPKWDSVKSFARGCVDLDLADWAQRFVATVQLATGHPKPEILGRALARWSMHDPVEFEIPKKAHSAKPAVMCGWVNAAAKCLAEVPQDVEVEISPNLTSTDLTESLKFVRGTLEGLELARQVHARMGTQHTAFCLAFAAYAAKNYELAVEIYRGIVAEYPDDFSSTRNLALAYAQACREKDLEGLRREIKGRPANQEKDWPRLAEEIGGLLREARQKHTELNKNELAISAMRSCNARLGAIITPEQLTLAQATALLALLRGCDLDHSTWKIAPLSTSQVPFAPSSRFINLLQDLANFGILGMDSVASSGVHAVDDRIEFDWSKVTFKLHPSGLELHRAIRDRPRQQWPVAWELELETLAISVAVEECMAYIWHLAAERSLQLPSDADLRSVYRAHLQNASAGRCWYFTFKTIQSANDYRTRVPAGKPQVAGYILNKLRQFGELAIERKWENSYNRLWALPRSHFAGALHDVLTGWGDSAFDLRIRDLVV